VGVAFIERKPFVVDFVYHIFFNKPISHSLQKCNFSVKRKREKKKIYK
jgi:hypothetical protein